MDSPEIAGIVPVLNTPLNADGSVDHDGLTRLIDFLAEKDVAAFWALGTGSEDMNLTFDKRLEVAETTVAATRGRVPVILGAGFFALEDTMRFIEATSHLDVAGYHHMLYHPLLGLDRHEWLYRHLADNCHRPVWMYYSSNWSRPMPPEFVRRLKGHPNIAGVKYSTKNAADNFEVISMADENFQVITAVATQLFACLAMGVKAHTSSLASSLPDFLIEIHALFAAGRIDEARQAQKRFNEFMAALPKEAKSSNFLFGAEEKYILKLRGICDEHVSSYYKGLSDENRRTIEQVLKEYDVLG